jgi:hypothetical protein
MPTKSAQADGPPGRLHFARRGPTLAARYLLDFEGFIAVLAPHARGRRLEQLASRLNPPLRPRAAVNRHLHRHADAWLCGDAGIGA